MTSTMKAVGFLIVAAVLLWAAVPLIHQAAAAIENAVAAIQANQAAQSIVLAYRPVPPDIGTSYSDAELGHSLVEIERVRNCFNKGGADFIYREKVDRKTIRFHLLCIEPDGTWADRIIQRINDACEEVTAFEPKQTKVWKTVLDWLERKQATPVKALP